MPKIKAQQLQKLATSYRRITITSNITMILFFLLFINAIIEFTTTPLLGEHFWLQVFINTSFFLITPINVICLVNLSNLRIEPNISQLQKFDYRHTAIKLWIPIVLVGILLLTYFTI